MKLKLQILLIFFSLILALKISAQGKEIRVSYLNSESGLSHNRVLSIFKDSYGEMWFGTLEGLNRYNSNSFEVYKRDVKQLHAFKSDAVYSMLEFPAGMLWLGTLEGVFRLDLKTQQFSSLSELCGKTPEGKLTYSLCSDFKENLYCGTDNGLIQYNIKTSEYSFTPLQGAKNIYQLKLTNDSLWLATDGGLFLYQTKTKSIKPISELSAPQGTSLNGTVFYALIRYPDGKMLAGHENGISLMIPSKNGYTFENYAYPEGLSKSEFLSVRTLSLKNDTGVFIGSQGFGACNFDVKNKKFSILPEFNTLKDKLIVSSFYDNEHTLWVGTLRHGVVKFGERNRLFSPEYIKNNRGEELSIYSMCRDAYTPGIVWFGANSDIVRYDTRTKRYETFSPFSRSELKYAVISIHDIGDRIIFSTYVSGIYVFDKNKKTFTEHTKLNELLERKPVFKIYNHSVDELFFYAGDNFVRYNIRTDSLIQKKLNVHRSQRIHAYYPVSDSKLLVGGYYVGLQLLNLDTYTVKPITLDTIPLTAVFHLRWVNDTSIWVSTYYHGICSYNPKTEKLSRLTGLDLPSIATFSAINSKVPGHLWMSSNDGLWLFDEIENRLSRFSINDGLQDTEFNSGAWLSFPNGELLFGGVSGINFIKDDSLSVKHVPVPLRLSKFKIRNEAVVPFGIYAGDTILTKDIKLTDSIVLSHRNNTFSIEFAGIDYDNAEKLKYKYMLEGFDTDWYYANYGNQTAVYTNLPPGEYTFVLHVADEHGIWTVEPKILTISIKPPFWRTNVFYVAVVLLLIVGIYLYTKNKNRALHRDKVLLEREVAQRTAEIVRATEALEAEMNFSDSVIREANDGIVVVTRTGDFLRTNQAFREMTGYSKFELQNLNIKKVIHPVDFKKFEQHCSLIFSKQNSITELRFQNNLAKSIHCRISSSKFSENAQISIITDITAQKNMERELKRHRQLLESEVEERTADLKRAKEKAETSDRLKSAFLANMSHEIRTPLNAVLGYAQLLQMPDLTEQQRSEYAQMINFGGETLLQLISDIIDIAKIEADQLTAEPEPFKLNAVLQNLQASFQTTKSNFDKTGVRLIADVPSDDFAIFADKLRFKQILINLISNALKFTDEGYVKIGYFPPEPAEKMVTFFVQDTGIGIPEEHINEIFERFRKLDNIQARLHRGTGLGLAISKRLVEMHGGRIWVESIVGSGSVFYFTIPLFQKK